MRPQIEMPKNYTATVGPVTDAVNLKLRSRKIRLDQLARDDLRSPVAAFSAARLISEA
jgi:hypothetical protein